MEPYVHILYYLQLEDNSSNNFKNKVQCITIWGVFAGQERRSGGEGAGQGAATSARERPRHVPRDAGAQQASAPRRAHAPETPQREDRQRQDCCRGARLIGACRDSTESHCEQ